MSVPGKAPAEVEQICEKLLAALESLVTYYGRRRIPPYEHEHQAWSHARTVIAEAKRLGIGQVASRGQHAP